MKTLRDIIETVERPKSKDEQDFVDKHVVVKQDHPEAEEGQFTSKKKKAKRLADNSEKESEKVYESSIKRFSQFMESSELVESVKAGSMKLKDGANVKLDKDAAEAINSLVSSMSSANKKKMHQRMMDSKKGFDEIVKFAKEAG
jgi:hypothetical protein